MSKQDNNAEAKVVKERKKEERQFALKLSQVVEMEKEPELLKAFINAYKLNEEMHVNMLFAMAKGAVQQQKLTLA